MRTYAYAAVKKVYKAADMYRRIHCLRMLLAPVAMLRNECKHRRYRRFSMAARYSHDLAVALGQHSERRRAFNLRNAPIACGSTLGIIRLYRRRIHNKVRFAVFGALADKHGYAERPQAFGKRRLSHIRALHVKAARMQYPRKPVHRASAYSDKMYQFMTVKAHKHPPKSLRHRADNLILYYLNSLFANRFAVRRRLNGMKPPYTRILSLGGDIKL